MSVQMRWCDWCVRSVLHDAAKGFVQCTACHKVSKVSPKAAHA